ncbi:hypothetical protein [Alteribacter natronophilus]|uniref:hypothetical protein n=1 Tax=Alteribacter natronophilus TaxID=2583810 RepID=UPI001486F1A0|nr:hypothetical protein [Alteribacter natronophilus]
MKLRKSKLSPRTMEEREQLDKKCIEKWNKAVKEGKIRKINDKEFYYGFDESDQKGN